MRWSPLCLALLCACSLTLDFSDPPERGGQCSDGVDNNGDGRLDCQEDCDAGHRVRDDGCGSSDQPERGNDSLEAGDDCDDGNAVDGDGCEAACSLPFCGNTIVDPGEGCDDGNAVDADSCEAD